MVCLLSRQIPTWGRAARSRSTSRYPGSWDGLVGAWFPSLGTTGQTLRDVSGWHNHGVLTNMDPATGWVVGEKGWALRLDDANDELVAVADAPNLRFGTGDFTLTAWARLTAFNTGIPTVLGKGDTGAGEWMWNLGVGFNGRNRFYGDGASINAQSATTPTVLGEWTFASVTRVGSLLTLYSNCQPVATDSSAGADLNSSKPLQIGCGDSSVNRHWTGDIGPLTIHRRALSRSELLRMYVDPFALVRRRVRHFPTLPADLPSLITSPVRRASQTDTSPVRRTTVASTPIRRPSPAPVPPVRRPPAN